MKIIKLLGIILLVFLAGLAVLFALGYVLTIGEYTVPATVDDDGNFEINLVHGVESFKNTVLFISGECQTIIGADWQSNQMEFFPSAELAVIPGAGHEMFAENPEASIAAVRAYLNSPVGK